MSNQRDYNRMMQKYPILFCQRNKGEMYSCMSFGIEAGLGWYRYLDELCSCLEQLNTVYKRFGIRIQADQVKQKFGGLRFYYSIVYDRCWYFKLLALPFELIVNLIDKFVKFEYQQILIAPEHFQDFTVQISKEQFDNKYCPSKITEYTFQQKDGKFYRTYSMKVGKTFKYELKKHHLLDAIKRKCDQISINVKMCKPLTERQRIIGKMMNTVTQLLIDRCEHKCWNVCEICGEENDHSQSKIITAGGYFNFRRLCKECAENV